VQCLLVVVCLVALVSKYALEHPRRELRIFLFDSSKQIYGAAIAHILNMLGATFLAQLQSDGDECHWYWVQIMTDTTFGTLTAYSMLQLSIHLFQYESGDYSKGIRSYWTQACIWIWCVCCAKALWIMIQWATASYMLMAANFVLQPFVDNAHLMLVFVMIFTPTAMNVFQILVTDQFLKKHVLQKKESHQYAQVSLESPTNLTTKIGQSVQSLVISPTKRKGGSTELD